MREIIGTVELRELNTDRKKFGDQVQEKAQSDMNALGIHIISCNIQRIEDEQGLINALGQDNMSKIQKDASIAKANADRDVAIAQAEANKAANDARVLSETEIAQKQTELAVKKAELKREADDRQAIADAAYEIQKQAQEKSIQTAVVNAAIAKAEREAELRQKEVLVKQQELAANIEKTADAEKYRMEKVAEANLIQRQKEADARKYEQEKEAEAMRIKAEAAMYQKTKEAEGIAAVGRAEAEAIEAKGLAEAQAMEKKAEAYAKYNNAAVTEMIINQLPAIATAIASPISAIDKVTVIDSGNGNGESGITNFGGVAPAMLKQTLESVKEVTGFDLLEVMKAQTYDAKVTRNINVTGLESNESKEVATEVLKDDVAKKKSSKKSDVVLDDDLID
jgi:flotillin